VHAGAASAANTVKIAESGLAPRAVDAKTAAALLGVGRSTLYKLTASGQFRQVHFGRSARWLISDLDAFLAQGGTDATASTGPHRLAAS